MLTIYSLILSLGFTLMLPLFILRRGKYAAGLGQRLGKHAEFAHDGRPVVWLHCVSVGETNAARPLIDQLIDAYPSHRLVISTTTRTGHELAGSIFKKRADVIFYFPFDWKFSVKRALDVYKPDVVLLMETEIWPRFISEAKAHGAKIAIVNGRLSKKSFHRYSRISRLVAAVLRKIDLALMQGRADAEFVSLLGAPDKNIRVTGNIKFDLTTDTSEIALTRKFRDRFALDERRLLIVAASTHAPEERLLLGAYRKILDSSPTKPRLLIAPRHPERFDDVTRIFEDSGFAFVRRTAAPAASDKTADLILLDSVGELRSLYSLADLVFVGGSLIPHGGQNILEPAAAGRAIVTGLFTHNFDAVVKEFLKSEALVQIGEAKNESSITECLAAALETLLRDPAARRVLGSNAAAVMYRNRGAAALTVKELAPLFEKRG